MPENNANTDVPSFTQRLLQRMRQYQFEWGVSLVCWGLISLFMYLGHWQLQRAEEKNHILAELETKQTAPAKTLENIDWQSDDLAFQPVQLQGRFDNRHIFLLDNRILNGQVGYEVIQAFNILSHQELDNKKVVFINRGWIVAGRTRKDLPAIEKINQIVKIHGTVYVQQGKSLLLDDNIMAESGWPRVVMAVDIDHFARVLGQPSYPHLVRLDELSAGAFKCQWQIVNMQPEKHIAYAIQWFSMALALVILYGVFSTRKRSGPGERNE